MVMGNLGTHAASVGLYKNLSYDPRTDFEPVMLVATTPMILLATRALPAATTPEFIALAKRRKLSMGSAGIGSISHLTLLLFAGITHTDIQHVPYRGLSQAANQGRLLGALRSRPLAVHLLAAEHKLAGESYVGPILVLDAAKGGVATAWMLHEMKARGVVPDALVLNTVNPIMVQGAALADFTMISGFDVDITQAIPNGVMVEVDPTDARPFIRIV
jgi:predicted aconitase with swiveling domain